MNQRFGTDFRITPTFRWQPRFYKKLHNVVLNKFDIPQKRKISTYFNAISEKQWMINQFKESISSIDNDLYRLRASNTNFKKHDEEVEEIMTNYIQKIESQLESANNLIDNIETTIDYVTSKKIGMYENIERDCIIFRTTIKNVHTTIYAGDEEIIVSMGDINVFTSVDLIQLLTESIKGQTLGSNSATSHTSDTHGATFRPLFEGIKFPYINNPNNLSSSASVPIFNHHGSQIDSYGQVCFGNYVSDIKNATYSGDLLAYHMLISQWTKSFKIGTTGPLNSYQNMFFGQLPGMDTLVWTNIGINFSSRGDNCNYSINHNIDKKDSYCDVNKCLLRTDCEKYIEVYGSNDTDILSKSEALIIDLRLMGNTAYDDYENWSYYQLKRKWLDIYESTSHYIGEFQAQFANHFNCRASTGLSRALMINLHRIDFSDAIEYLHMSDYEDVNSWVQNVFEGHEHFEIEFEELEPPSDLEQSLLDQYRSNPTISEARVNLNDAELPF
jgi:hypothetical protein